MTRTVHEGTTPIIADATDQEAYEAERLAVVAKCEADFGPGGLFRASLAEDFNSLSWTYTVRT